MMKQFITHQRETWPPFDIDVLVKTKHGKFAIAHIKGPLAFSSGSNDLPYFFIPYWYPGGAVGGTEVLENENEVVAWDLLPDNGVQDTSPI